MRNVLIVFVCLLSVALCGTGCSNYSGTAYSGQGQIRKTQTVHLGKVVSVQEVTLEEDDAPIAGTVVGGALGGVLGSMIGGGKGRVLSTVAGAALGAAGGYAGQKAISKQKGLEIMVRIDSTGETLSVVQAADTHFTPGQEVRVLIGRDGSARVTSR